MLDIFTVKLIYLIIIYISSYCYKLYYLCKYYNILISNSKRKIYIFILSLLLSVVELVNLNLFFTISVGLNGSLIIYKRFAALVILVYKY